MRHYYSADAIREAEAPLLASLPDGALMRRAAYGLATAIIGELTARTGGVAGRRVCAVVGSGDNGGDALWAATFLRRRGVAADAILLNPERTHQQGPGRVPPSRRPDRRKRRRGNRSRHRRRGRYLRLRPAAARRGRGLRGGRRRRRSRWSPSTSPAASTCATGAITGPAVHAALTVTFGGLKPVHALADCGRVEADRHRPRPARHRRRSASTPADVAARWPVPGPHDDKYTQGVTGVMAGSSTYPGAAVLCTGAAVAATSGMVRYAGSAHSEVLAHWPEVIASPTPAAAGRVQSWVVGPGLGTDETGAAALWFALETDLPVLVDADGLTILAAHPDLLADRRAPTVLTPHAGEFARLAGAPPGDDRVGATRKLADAFGATVLLKGNVTVIADPGGPVYLNPAGQSWAATAGSGDVLSGMIGALLAAGLPPARPPRLAAFVHARAAELSAADPGPGYAPTSASRIVAHIRTALAAL